MKKTFHLVALPHTNVTEDFFHCAYTAKIHLFTRMMRSLGHDVFLYAGEQTTANPTELITCISEEERSAAVGKAHFTSTSFDNTLPHWQTFNNNVIKEIGKRIKKTDFILISGGLAQKPIADSFPNHMSVEWGIGYSGTFAKYKVYESHTWRAACSTQWKNASSVDINLFETVINGYFDPAVFSMELEKEDYYVYLGRMTQRKGVDIAAEACKAAGVKLIFAGSGDYIPSYGEYIGPVNSNERKALLGKAIASFSPTTYLEPFCNSHVESLACGTPVISTDFGIFTETIQDDFNGYRCNTLSEFVQAINAVKKLDHRMIATDAFVNFSMDVIRFKYDRYFNRLLTLWEDGWYQL